MKKIKIITTADSGGLIDQINEINREFNKIGYKSQIVKINKFKDRKIKNIKKGDNVIFQMSAYGYQKKGMPLWLINEFRNLKNKTSSLGIFFHELFVTANFWDPRFLITVVQKYINIKLLNYCDYWITSNKNYANWIKNNSNVPKNYICPVHSNITHKVLEFKKDKKLAVIFGTEGSRVLIYRKYFNELKEWVSKNNIKLLDVGPELKDFDLKLLCKDQFNIKIMGKLSSRKISNLFSKSFFGIFMTPDDLVDKSGVLSAYSFYKVCPINLHEFSNKNKNKNIKKKRFLKYLPNLKNKNLNTKEIVRYNFRFSRKNSLKELVNTYKINFN